MRCERASLSAVPLRWEVAWLTNVSGPLEPQIRQLIHFLTTWTKDNDEDSSRLPSLDTLPMDSVYDNKGADANTFQFGDRKPKAPRPVLE